MKQTTSQIIRQPHIAPWAYAPTILITLPMLASLIAAISILAQ
ncbi:MAG: hypothetical protein ACI8V2_003785 [Candidatus Latescibacterota bacterium]|jgi:hypothetical protein